MIIHTMEQRSPEWKAQRAKCLLTASSCGPFLVKDDKKSKDARLSRIFKHLTQACYTGGDAWLVDLAAKEDRQMDYNIPVQRGIAYEDQAIATASRMVGAPVQKVGLITTDDGLFGASPDGLFGEDAGLECKVPLPETHLGYLIEHLQTGEMVDDYLMQVHMGMAIAQRSTWHFYSHSVEYLDGKEVRRDPPLHIEVKAGKKTEEIAAGMDRFRQEFARVREMLHDQRLTKMWRAAFEQKGAA